jgi:hypothetical protein
VKNFFQIIHLSPPNLATFAPWRESNSSVRVFQCSETFAQAAKILKDSNTEFAEWSFTFTFLFGFHPLRLRGATFKSFTELVLARLATVKPEKPKKEDFQFRHLVTP